MQFGLFPLLFRRLSGNGSCVRFFWGFSHFFFFFGIKADGRQDVLKRFTIDFPDGNKEGCDDRAHDNTDDAEHGDTAKGGKEDEKIVHFGVFSHQPRADKVVGIAGDQPTEDADGDGSSNVLAKQQNNQGWPPDDGCSNTGNYGENGHQAAPENRTGNTGEGESHPAKGALDHPDDQSAFDGGSGHRGKTLQQVLLVIVFQGDIIEDLFQERLAVDKKVKHGVEHDKGHEGGVDCQHGNGGERVNEQGGGVAHQVAKFLQDHVPMGKKLFVIGQFVQIIGDDGGLVNKLLHPRCYGLADVDGLGHDHADESGQGQEDETDQDKDSEQRSRILSAFEKEKEPVV